MAVFIYRVGKYVRTPFGFKALPGVPMRELGARPEMGKLRQGVVLELRSAQGALRTHLVNYGVEATQSPEGHLQVPAEPRLHFILPGDLDEAALVVGGELWWLDEEPGLSSEQVKQQLERFK